MGDIYECQKKIWQSVFRHVHTLKKTFSALRQCDLRCHHVWFASCQFTISWTLALKGGFSLCVCILVWKYHTLTNMKETCTNQPVVSSGGINHSSVGESFKWTFFQKKSLFHTLNQSRSAYNLLVGCSWKTNQCNIFVTIRIQTIKHGNKTMK